MKTFHILIMLNLILTCHTRKSIRQRRTLIFPPSSPCFGVFIAISVPLNMAYKNVFVSYNFEGQFTLVSNITQIDEVLFPNLPIISSRHGRRISRKLAYTVLESKFRKNGINSRDCLLRNICEAAETPLVHSGILGHLLHFIFTPSASRDEGLDEVYYEAEAAGLRGDCDKYEELCPTSLFEYITRLVEYPHDL